MLVCGEIQMPRREKFKAGIGHVAGPRPRHYCLEEIMALQKKLEEGIPEEWVATDCLKSHTGEPHVAARFRVRDGIGNKMSRDRCVIRKLLCFARHVRSTGPEQASASSNSGGSALFFRSRRLGHPAEKPQSNAID